MAEPSVVPAVFYRDPMAALHWREKAFGVQTSMLVTDDDGNVGHAEMSFGDGRIGIGGEWSSPEQLGAAEMKSPLSLGGGGAPVVRGPFWAGRGRSSCASICRRAWAPTANGPAPPGPASPRSRRTSSTARAPIAPSIP